MGKPFFALLDLCLPELLSVLERRPRLNRRQKIGCVIVFHNNLHIFVKFVSFCPNYITSEKQSRKKMQKVVK